MAPGVVGKVSLNPMPDNDSVPGFGFVRVNVSVDSPLVKIESGENDLTISGGAYTVSEAVA